MKTSTTKKHARRLWQAEMRRFKAQVTNTTREDLQTFNFHYPPTIVCTMDVIPELIRTENGDRIGESDIQPGGKWEDFLIRQLRCSSEVDSSDDESSESVSTGYTTPVTTTSPIDHNEQCNNFSEDPASCHQTDLDLTLPARAKVRMSSSGDSTTQESAVTKKERECDDAVFADFPTCLTRSQHLSPVDDEEYGLMAIAQDSTWKHLSFDGLPTRVRRWIADFTIGNAMVPSASSAYNIAMADCHTWLFATPATEFVCNTVSFDMWYRPRPAEPSIEQQ
ncbi:unnamed protein product [Discula destructiva]